LKNTYTVFGCPTRIYYCISNTSVIDLEDSRGLPLVFSASMNTFTALVSIYKNKNTYCCGMPTFSERVKSAWKNIYPLQEASEREKKNKKK